MSKSMTDLQEAIQNLEAMARCIEGVVKLLQRVQARPWPEIPNGEGTIEGAILDVGVDVPLGEMAGAGERYWKTKHDDLVKLVETGNRAGEESAGITDQGPRY